MATMTRLLCVLLVGLVSGCRVSIPTLAEDASPTMQRIHAVCLQQASYQSCLNGVEVGVDEAIKGCFEGIDRVKRMQQKATP